jgi:hypothetical protein
MLVPDDDPEGLKHGSKTGINIQMLIQEYWFDCYDICCADNQTKNYTKQNRMHSNDNVFNYVCVLDWFKYFKTAKILKFCVII